MRTIVFYCLILASLSTLIYLLPTSFPKYEALGIYCDPVKKSGKAAQIRSYSTNVRRSPHPMLHFVWKGNKPSSLWSWRVRRSAQDLRYRMDDLEVVSRKEFNGTQETVWDDWMRLIEPLRGTIDVVAMGYWFEHSTPPVITRMKRLTGETRQFSAYLSALLSLNYSVLVVPRNIPVDVHWKNETGVIWMLTMNAKGVPPDVDLDCFVGIPRNFWGYPQVEPKFTTITVLDNPQWSARERTYQIGYPDICYVADNATRVFNDDYIILWGHHGKDGCLKGVGCPWLNEKRWWVDLVKILQKDYGDVRIRVFSCDKWCNFEKIFLEIKQELNYTIECLERYPQEQFMDILKHARLLFTIGETKDSPTPIDVLACGTPIVMPHEQHKFLEETFYSFRNKREIGVSDDEMLSIVGTSDQMLERILKGITIPRAPKRFRFHSAETIRNSFQEFMDDMQMQCFSKSGITLSLPRRHPSYFRLNAKR